MAQWSIIGHGLFASEPTGNLFYLRAVIFEIPKKYFIIKPSGCWGADVSIEIYKLLLLFSIITPCTKRNNRSFGWIMRLVCVIFWNQWWGWSTCNTSFSISSPSLPLLRNFSACFSQTSIFLYSFTVKFVTLSSKLFNVACLSFNFNFIKSIVSQSEPTSW